MPNYVPTGPFVNGGSPGVQSSFLNAVESVFKQKSGGTETGKYYLKGSSYANAANMGNYMPSLSRGATPVSVAIDEADQAHAGGNANAATTANLTSNGFLVYSSGTGVLTLWQVGGNWTIQY